MLIPFKEMTTSRNYRADHLAPLTIFTYGVSSDMALIGLLRHGIIITETILYEKKWTLRIRIRLHKI